MKETILCFLLGIFILFHMGCDPADDGGSDPDPNPVPTLSSISPTERVSHLPTFTLTVTGSNFVSGSTIVFNGQEVVTTFVSATELTGQIEPGHSVSSEANLMDLNNPPDTDVNVPVLVRNPTPGGGDSNGMQFNLIANFTFATAVNLSNHPNDYFAYNPDIGLDDDDRIYLVWERYNLNNNTVVIMFSRSTNGGSSWTTPKKISKNLSASITPRMAVSPGGELNVVWTQYENNFSNIYFCRSSDQGSNWSTPDKIADTANYSRYPKISLSPGGRLAVAWSEGPNTAAEVYFSDSSDSGSTWGTQTAVNDNGIGKNGVSSLAYDLEGSLLVSWTIWKTVSNMDIFFQRSTDNGSTWSSRDNLTNTSTDSRNGIVKSNHDSSLLFMWYDGSSSNRDVYVKRSDTDGSTWTSATMVTSGSDVHRRFDFSVDSVNNLNVVGKLFIATPHSNTIYFSRSIDNGESWTSQLVISNSGTSSSDNPAVASDSNGRVYVVWEDREDGPFDIFFTHSTN